MLSSICCSICGQCLKAEPIKKNLLKILLAKKTTKPRVCFHTVKIWQFENFYNIYTTDLHSLYHKSQKSNTHTHLFNGPFSGTTRVSWYQKGKTNLNFPEARDSEWQWHQLGHMQVCT